MEINKSTDYIKGFQDGEKNKSINIAIRMLIRNYDKDLIKEFTGLNDEQLFIVGETLNHHQQNVDNIINEYNYYKK